jgi:SAM-dependent methyltransferase
MSFIPVEQFQRKTWAPGDPLAPHINYACGIKPISGWTNTDYFDGSVLWRFKDTGIPAELALNVLHIDLIQPHPFPDGSFDGAFCEDFIEHIDQRSSLLFLTEVFRTLKPGGTFRISTPGLEGVLRRHFGSAERSHVEKGINDAFERWGHVHFYTHGTLEAVATSLGFVNYTRCDFGLSARPALCGLDTREDQRDLNLYAEMSKPG